VSASPLPVPSGDPDTVKRAAVKFDMIGADHQAQLAAFDRQVTDALASWRGPVAEQFAVLAGDAARRFAAVVTALTTIQGALRTYASALEAAQNNVNSLNRTLSLMNGEQARHEAASANAQEAAALNALSQAARTCDQVLQAAATTLVAHCPDILPAQKFVQVVKNAENRLNNPQQGGNSVGLYSGLEYMLTAYALFASTEGGVEGAKADAVLTESKSLLKALQAELTPAARRLILSQVKDPFEQAKLLSSWETLTVRAEEGVENARIETKIKGGSFLGGMIQAQTIQVAEQGEHASDDAGALDALFRTSKVDLILAPVTIALGIHDLIWPSGTSGWEKTGNQVAGVAGVFGGALALASWAAGLFGVTWEIPVVDLGTGTLAGVMLLAATLWAAGDAIYDFRHQIWDGLKDTGESIAHIPGEVVHGLESIADPLDW
jgi:type IV secretory pathway VirB2 component (pilin)